MNFFWSDQAIQYALELKLAESEAPQSIMAKDSKLAKYFSTSACTTLAGLSNTWLF